MTLMLLLHIMTFVLTFARGKRIKEKAKILVCLNVVSLLVAIRRIFSDGSFPSICCSQPVQRGDFYQVGSRGGGRGGEMFGSSCPPPPHGQPLRVWRLSRAMRGWRGYGGSLSEAHIVAPRDPSSSGLQAQLSRTQNWGRELPGFPLVGAGWEGERVRKRGKKGQSLQARVARRDARIVLISKMV